MARRGEGAAGQELGVGRLRRLLFLTGQEAVDTAAQVGGRFWGGGARRVVVGQELLRGASHLLNARQDEIATQPPHALPPPRACAPACPAPV